MPPVTKPRASAMTLNERPSRKRTAIANALPQRISPVESAPNAADKSRRGRKAIAVINSVPRSADTRGSMPCALSSAGPRSRTEARSTTKNPVSDRRIAMLTA